MCDTSIPVNILYTFTKKRNYIGRLHFDTFGCLTPHTTDRACFFRLAAQPKRGRR